MTTAAALPTPSGLPDWNAITAAVNAVRGTLGRLASSDTRELPRLVRESPDFVEQTLDDAEAAFEALATELRRRIDVHEPARLAAEEARVRAELVEIEQRRNRLEARAARSPRVPDAGRAARAARRGERSGLLRDVDRALERLKRAG